MNSLGSLSAQDNSESITRPKEEPEEESSYSPNETSSEGDTSDYTDEEEYDEINKLEENIQKEFLLSHHPELKQINYDELLALSTVIRDKKGNIIDQLHKTQPFLTKYEKARILGIRCKQINNGSQIFVAINDKIIDGYNIALKELEEKKIPFIIQRPLPNGVCEYWKVSDLELIN